MISTSKSKTIRNIENNYNFSMTNCKSWFMDKLTNPTEGQPVIKSFKDLMFDDHVFDLENMTEQEITHLRYLVLSMKEVLSTIDKKVKCVYYKPSYARLRFLMSYDDFYQACIDKLLLNNGILKFDANYKFEPAVQFWFDRVAAWKCKHKVKTADELTILDQPCSEDSETTMGDLLPYRELDETNDIELEVNLRINNLLNSMDKTPSNRISFKAGDTTIPMSEYILAKLFIQHHLGKKELSKMMYNNTTKKLVSNQIFNKFYKNTLIHLSELINKEYNEVGGCFSIDSKEL